MLFLVFEFPPNARTHGLRSNCAIEDCKLVNVNDCSSSLALLLRERRGVSAFACEPVGSVALRRDTGRRRACKREARTQGVFQEALQ